MHPLPFARSLGLVLLLSSGVAAAGAAEPTGTRPAPKRELSTDRPDATESPFTVEPGFMQLEMDFANVTRDREDGVRTVEWEAAPFNLRIGVTRDFEAGIFIVPYRRVRETAGSFQETNSGFGDAVLRGKLNLFGNDGGARALGVILDMKIPTAPRRLSNRKVEGALTLPVAFDLGNGVGLGAMTSIEGVYTDEARFRAVWSNTITVARDLTENVGGFVELTSSTGVGSHVATFNFGLTRALSRDAQLDCGVNLGLSRAAPDAAFFAGLSRRF